MSLEDTIRATVRDVVREVLQEELQPLVEQLAGGAAVAGDGYLSVAEAAEIAGVHENTVRGWLKDGRLPRRKAGTKWRVRRADLDACLAGGAPRTPSPTVAEALAAIVKREKSPA